MSDVNKQLLEALKGMVSYVFGNLEAGKSDVCDELRHLIAAAEQAQQAEPVAADPAVAAIQFALETHSDGLHFLRLWNEGEFDLLRQEWPEAPEDIYIGADPLIEVPAHQQAVAVPDGYALVPIEPTEGMLDAASQIAIDWPDGFPNHLEGYRAMLAAAPDATTIGVKCC